MQAFDVLIIGSGLGGMTMALHLAEKKRVALVTKRNLRDGGSGYAQGGIAAVLDDADSIENHIRDTFTAGADLCDPDATRFVVENSRTAIDWLIDMGVPFTRSKNESEPDYHGYHLTREGGHSHRRIIHAADATGAAVIDTLATKVAAHPNITVLENHIAIDLITDHKLGREGKHCWGAYVFDKQEGHVKTLMAPNTVLATGGTDKHTEGFNAYGTAGWFALMGLGLLAGGWLLGGTIGATLTQVAQRMVELGCVTALSLDGGGSTAMVATSPDSTVSTLVDKPSGGSERAVTNHIFLVADSQPTNIVGHVYLESESTRYFRC